MIGFTMYVKKQNNGIIGEYYCLISGFIFDLYENICLNYQGQTAKVLRT